MRIDMAKKQDALRLQISPAKFDCGIFELLEAECNSRLRFVEIIFNHNF
jgi:hypothetical protein